MTPACYLSEGRLVARAATITWWALSTTAWQLYACWKSRPPGPGMMRESGPVKSRLVLGNARMTPSLGVRGVGTGSVVQRQLHHLRLVQCQVQWA